LNCRSAEFAKGAIEPWQDAANFDYSHDREIICTEDRLNTCLTHHWPGGSKELEIGSLLTQCFDQGGGVSIS
jgi:hypothetical protein